jgi:hypothetical protein
MVKKPAVPVATLAPVFRGLSRGALPDLSAQLQEQTALGQEILESLTKKYGPTEAASFPQRCPHKVLSQLTQRGYCE